MQFGGPSFVLAIIAMSFVAWIITTAIRARHGYPIEDEFGKTIFPHDPAGDAKSKALAAENQELSKTIGLLENRLKVLERIATDPAERVSTEIEQLR
jgi:hypothetical protein